MADSEPCSGLARALQSGRLAVTAELGPPVSCDGDVIRRKAQILKGCVDAANITDAQTAAVRMCSMAGAAILLQEGLEPVLQMTTRDRNRIALQCDILGAAALGVRNCLCLTGDHQSLSSAGRQTGHPGAKNVYDIDAVQLIQILRQMRDEGMQQGGDPLDKRPDLFIGGAWAPLADPADFRVIRLANKVAAGAGFVQTQGVYDVPRFAEVMEQVRRRGLHEQVAIMVGIIVPRGAGMLRYMDSSVPGVSVPRALIERFPAVERGASAEARKQAREQSRELGKSIAVEIIEQVREIEGVRGIHLQAIEWEEAVPEIARRAGLV